jgi:hypothetical protein
VSVLLGLLLKNFFCARDFHFFSDFLPALFPVPKLVLSRFLCSSLGASFSLRYGTDFWSSCWVCSSDLFFSPAVLVSVNLSALEISCLVFSIYVLAVHFLKRQDLRFSLLISVSSSILVPLVQQFTRTIFLPCLIWCMLLIRSCLVPRILVSRGRNTDFVPACFSWSRVKPRQRFPLGFCYVFVFPLVDSIIRAGSRSPRALLALSSACVHQSFFSFPSRSQCC